MGEVFRARDTRLNRDVAARVLPKDFVADADRLRRFGMNLERSNRAACVLELSFLFSAHPSLIRQVSESLAGRVGILDLDPFTVSEVAGRSPRRAMHELWLRGGFPDAFSGNFREWWEAYLRTYVERDLSQLGVGADPILLRRLLLMLAHCQGGLLNLSQLGQSLGVSYHTVDRYVDVGATHGWVLDQSAGVTPLLPNVECSGFAGAFDWLPNTPSAPNRRAKKKSATSGKAGGLKH